MSSEFDKWWETQCPPDRMFIKPDTKDAWVAALKWIECYVRYSPNGWALFEKELEALNNDRNTT